MRTGIRVIIVSTGRCGTTRVAEILQKYLPENCKVFHQTRFSRLANIIGNIQYHFSIGETCGNYIYNKIMNEAQSSNFILVDPLSSMIVPRQVIGSDKTFIIHLVRDPDEFAISMFRLTRIKEKSFIAHNFIPFWQPYLFPCENILSKNILGKYSNISNMKNIYFEQKFSSNPHYTKMSMKDVFLNNTLSVLISSIFDTKIDIPKHELLIKTNQTQA